MTLYCDLDGVLVDFDKGVFDIIGKYPKDITNVGYLWSIINKHKNFWIDLNWMPDGEELWNYIFLRFDCEILTGVPDCGQDKKQNIETEKKMWCEKNLKRETKKEIKVNVCASKDKNKFCKNNDILIDDRFELKEGWEKMGGIFVYHTSTKNTIKELELILNMGCDNYKIYLEEQNLFRIANPTEIRKFDKDKNESTKFEYLGLFLTVSSKKKILELFPPKFASVFADHIVLSVGKEKDKDIPKEIQMFTLGENIEFTVIDYYSDKSCESLTVKLSNSSNIYILPISMTRKTSEEYSLNLVKNQELRKEVKDKDVKFNGIVGAMVNEKSDDSEKYIMLGL